MSCESEYIQRYYHIHITMNKNLYDKNDLLYISFKSGIMHKNDNKNSFSNSTKNNHFFVQKCD